MIALPPVPQPRAGGAGGTKGLPDLAEPWGKRDSPGAKGQQRQGTRQPQPLTARETAFFTIPKNIPEPSSAKLVVWI